MATQSFISHSLFVRKMHLSKCNMLQSYNMPPIARVPIVCNMLHFRIWWRSPGIKTLELVALPHTGTGTPQSDLLQHITRNLADCRLPHDGIHTFLLHGSQVCPGGGDLHDTTCIWQRRSCSPSDGRIDQMLRTVKTSVLLKRLSRRCSLLAWCYRGEIHFLSCSRTLPTSCMVVMLCIVIDT